MLLLWLVEATAISFALARSSATNTQPAAFSGPTDEMYMAGYPTGESEAIKRLVRDTLMALVGWRDFI